MKKEELKEKCSAIVDLIEQTDITNVYNNIVAFFQMASELYDRRSEIDSIPLKEKAASIWMRLFSKEQAQKIDEKVGDLWRQKLGLLQTIKNCGRNMNWNNRTQKGEKVTKDNVYFGGFDRLATLPVSKWEEFKIGTPRTYELIARQMLEFMQNRKAGFTQTNWC